MLREFIKSFGPSRVTTIADTGAHTVLVDKRHSSRRAITGLPGNPKWRMAAEADAPAPIRPRKSRTWMAVLVAVLAVAVAVGFAAYEYGYFQTTPPSGGPSLMYANCGSVSNSTSAVEGSASGGVGPHAYFLIVEADPGSPYEGINGSAIQESQNLSKPWPVMHVRLGQVVSIHVINCASSESHGFAIDHYDDKTINAVPPGKSYDVTFTANEKGTFRVYCDIFCAIHVFMQNGELIVS